MSLIHVDAHFFIKMNVLLCSCYVCYKNIICYCVFVNYNKYFEEGSVNQSISMSVECWIMANNVNKLVVYRHFQTVPHRGIIQSRCLHSLLDYTSKRIYSKIDSFYAWNFHSLSYDFNLGSFVCSQTPITANDYVGIVSYTRKPHCIST